MPITREQALRDMSPFPVQSGRAARRESGPTWTIPRWVAALAYDQFVEDHGDTVSLKQIEESGGFDWFEIVALLRGCMPDDLFGED